jgi:hypothetical protein
VNSNGWSVSKSGNFVDSPVNKAGFELRGHELDSIIRDDVESERSLIANGATRNSKVNAMNINVETEIHIQSELAQKQQSKPPGLIE